jgi:hypothetical protein
MMRSVSFFSDRYFRSTGPPTRSLTVGGDNTFHTWGNLELRGQTCSVPHTPTGITGALDSWASRAAPQRPFKLGVEERLAPGDGALGHQGHHLACGKCVGGGGQRLVRSTAPLHADATKRSGDIAHQRRVKHLLLAKEAHRPAGPGHHHAHRQRVEIRAVVGHDDRRTLLRQQVDAVHIEAHVGEKLASDKLKQQLLRLDAQKLGHPGG